MSGTVMGQRCSEGSQGAVPVACLSKMAHDSSFRASPGRNKRGIIFSKSGCTLGSGTLHVNCSCMPHVAKRLIVQLVVCRLQTWQVERNRAP